MLKGTGSTVRRARLLRRTMSPPEVMLWQVLRIRPDGFKFRRQHPAGSYVLDFFCAEARLAIEVDGIAHDLGDRPAADDARDRWLCLHGVDTMHVAAKNVLAGPAIVADRIVALCKARLPLHQPAAGPPPRSGED